MRRLAAVLVLLAPAIASAEVWQDRVIPCEPGQLARLTSSSHVLYVNDCLPGGCNVNRGQDSSLTNTSSIAAGAGRVMSPYMHGTEHWDQVIACVKETFAPFDITVVTDDPGPGVAHYEVMAAGTSAELNPDIEDAGGIAPFIACGANRDNALAFVFANQTSSINYLCAAIAHEAGHVYGLSHSLDALDPMTYMDLGSRKYWQNAEQTCGTSTPQGCRCFQSTQNSFRYLNTTFGLAAGLAPATMALTRPRDGAYVKPGFAISAAFTSPLSTLDAGLSIDGGAPEPAANGLLAWNAPASLAPGEHTVEVSATDFGDRSAAATATVHVMASCAAGEACASGFACLGGFCVPGGDVAGGLGAGCTVNDECVTGTCASDGSQSVCTAACDAGNVCPAGFECRADAGVCWPEDGGGCNVGGGSPFALLATLGLIVLGLRRRT